MLHRNKIKLRTNAVVLVDPSEPVERLAKHAAQKNPKVAKNSNRVLTIIPLHPCFDGVRPMWLD